MDEELKYRRVTIDDRDSKVVFEVDDDRMVLDPPVAVMMAEALIDAATRCGYVVEVQVQHRPFTDAQRLTLIRRVEIMLGALADKPRPKQAVEIVDTVLAEAL